MSRNEKILAAALLTVLVALLLVGLVSGTLVRHVVQAVPVLAAGLVVWVRPGWSRFAAMPIFVFWLFIMLLIWLFLLGLANVISGRFAPAEIGLTVVIGVASAIGLWATARRSEGASWWTGAVAFMTFSALQIGAMWLSLRPGVQ